MIYDNAILMANVETNPLIQAVQYEAQSMLGLVMLDIMKAITLVLGR